MTNRLVNYWKVFQPSTTGLNLHPTDLEWLRKSSLRVLEQPVLRSHAEYVRSERFDDKKLLHLSLLPVPYIGNLEKADIIIFLQNLGFTPADYFLEEDLEFRALANRNLKQQKIPGYPFIYLDPKFAWCSGFQWWEAKFKPIIKCLMIERKRTYLQVLEEISHRIAAVELFPYHSADSRALGAKWHKWPSAQQAQGYLAEIADVSEKLKVVVRSRKSWIGDRGYPESKHFPTLPPTRGITFNHNLRTGRLILDHLRQGR